MLTITIKEEQFGTGIIDQYPITLSSERLTLSDLICQKVAAQIKRLREELPDRSHGYAHLSDDEKRLNQAHLQKRTERLQEKIGRLDLDTEKAGYEALAAFQQHAFFVIVDGQQREHLAEEIILSPHSDVSFIRLIPLVGG